MYNLPTLPTPMSVHTLPKGDVSILVDYNKIRNAFGHYIPSSFNIELSAGFIRQLINLQGPAMSVMFHDVVSGHHTGIVEFMAISRLKPRLRLVCRVPFAFQHFPGNGGPTKVKVTIEPGMCRESTLG